MRTFFGNRRADVLQCNVSICGESRGYVVTRGTRCVVAAGGVVGLVDGI